jgi:hypothetical protein
VARCYHDCWVNEEAAAVADGLCSCGVGKEDDYANVGVVSGLLFPVIAVAVAVNVAVRVIAIMSVNAISLFVFVFGTSFIDCITL